MGFSMLREDLTMDDTTMQHEAAETLEDGIPEVPQGGLEARLGMLAKATVDTANDAAAARAEHELLMSDPASRGMPEQMFAFAQKRRQCEQFAHAALDEYIREASEGLKARATQG